MPYSQVRVTNIRGELIAFAILNENADNRLHSSVLYAPEELSELDRRLAELNESEALGPFWPNQHDAEVMTLVNNPDFLPEHPMGGDPTTVFKRHNEASRRIARQRAGYDEQSR